jgi:endoglucanase
VVAALVAVHVTGQASARAADGQLRVAAPYGRVQRAAGTPTGTEAFLWAGPGSTTVPTAPGTGLTTTATGSGAVVLHARADLCKGGARVEVDVDRKLLGTTTLVNGGHAYLTYAVGSSVGWGTHSIAVTLLNQYKTSACSRNAHIGWVTMQYSSSPPALKDGTVNPFLAGAPYNDGNADAAAAASAIRATSPSDAAAIDKIARQPQAFWVDGWTSAARVGSVVHDYAAAANAAGRTAIIVTYGIPARDCGEYSAGGLSLTAYPAWAAAVAHGLHGLRSAVIVEPDALAELGDCAGQGDRTRMIRDEVNELADAGASVYIDAGNSKWKSAATMAQRLTDAGIARARGFSVNVSNFGSDSEERQFAETLATMLKGKRYVLDSSRNGNGRLAGPMGWCNPPGRALGRPPAAVQNDGRLDAFVWIKHPGRSDGTCNGGPPAGVFWPAYAIGLAQAAHW